MSTGDVDARLAQLEARVQELSDRLTTLAVCKLADPRYPYFEWQVSHPMSAQEQVKLDLLLRVLSARFAGEEVNGPVRAKAQQVVPHVSLDAGPPSFGEIASAIREALGWRRPEQVLELLQSMHDQGSLEEFTAHALRDAVAGSTADHQPPG